jgi:hypothetical protein
MHLLALILVFLTQSKAYLLIKSVIGSPVRSQRSLSTNLRLGIGSDITSVLLSVNADYASEIENAVGEEVYGPIFKAGIFIFASGLVSAAIVAFIVSYRDSWDDLGDEIVAGKEAQLIEQVTMDNISQFRSDKRPEVGIAPGEVVSSTISTLGMNKGGKKDDNNGSLDSAVEDLDL